MALVISTYFVKASGDRDLIVRAYTTNDVLRHWREYYDVEADAQPNQILRLPRLPLLGAIRWNDIRTVYRNGD